MPTVKCFSINENVCNLARTEIGIIVSIIESGDRMYRVKICNAKNMLNIDQFRIMSGYSLLKLTDVEYDNLYLEIEKMRSSECKYINGTEIIKGDYISYRVIEGVNISSLRFGRIVDINSNDNYGNNVIFSVWNTIREKTDYVHPNDIRSKEDLVKSKCKNNNVIISKKDVLNPYTSKSDLSNIAHTKTSVTVQDDDDEAWYGRWAHIYQHSPNVHSKYKFGFTNKSSFKVSDPVLFSENNLPAITKDFLDSLCKDEIVVNKKNLENANEKDEGKSRREKRSNISKRNFKEITRKSWFRNLFKRS